MIQARWLTFFCEFYFEIKHVKGKEIKVADALSRRMCVLHAAAVSTCKLDGYYLQVKEKLQQGNSQQKYKDFRLEEDGILMH